jgi:hypothetical protein
MKHGKQTLRIRWIFFFPFLLLSYCLVRKWQAGNDYVENKVVRCSSGSHQKIEVHDCMQLITCEVGTDKFRPCLRSLHTVVYHGSYQVLLTFCVQQMATITPCADSNGLLKISLQLIKSACAVIGNAKMSSFMAQFSLHFLVIKMV